MLNWFIHGLIIKRAKMHIRESHCRSEKRRISRFALSAAAGCGGRWISAEVTPSSCYSPANFASRLLTLRLACTGFSRICPVDSISTGPHGPLEGFLSRGRRLRSCTHNVLLIFPDHTLDTGVWMQIVSRIAWTIETMCEMLSSLPSNNSGLIFRYPVRYSASSILAW